MSNKYSNVNLPVYPTNGRKTFYLSLSSHYTDKATFLLTVNFQPTTDWEIEDNDTITVYNESVRCSGLLDKIAVFLVILGQDPNGGKRCILQYVGKQKYSV